MPSPLATCYVFVLIRPDQKREFAALQSKVRHCSPALAYTPPAPYWLFLAQRRHRTLDTPREQLRGTWLKAWDADVTSRAQLERLPRRLNRDVVRVDFVVLVFGSSNTGESLPTRYRRITLSMSRGSEGGRRSGPDHRDRYASNVALRVERVSWIVVKSAAMLASTPPISSPTHDPLLILTGKGTAGSSCPPIVVLRPPRPFVLRSMTNEAG